MARDMYLVGVSEEELKPDPKPEGPRTPRGKWENYWYHYKWHTIGAVAVLVVLAVLIGQMVTRDPSDYTLVLVTEEAVPQAVLDRLAAELEAAGADLDGDGKIEVAIDSLTMSGDTQTGMVGPMKLQAHLASADVMLFAFEPSMYEQYIKAHEDEDFQFFARLDVETDGLVEDGRAWDWKDDSRRQEDPLLGALPEDLYFGVRDTSGIAEGQGEMKEDCLALMKAFITDTPLPQPSDASQP